jgi:GNAT superfamily N-acetyltransferase
MPRGSASSATPGSVPVPTNRGLAHALVAGAEAEARRRACARVAFHAYDLLARGLYERLGYETVGVIENCPSGSAARWYRKVR